MTSAWPLLRAGYPGPSAPGPDPVRAADPGPVRAPPGW